MKTSKIILSVVSAITIASAAITPAIVMAWGDSANGRPSYTIEEINAGKLGDKITFNSISDGKIGDEKNFVGAIETSKINWKNVKSSDLTWNANEITIKDGETYTVRLYVHNNSPKGEDAIAKDVKATFSLPTTVASSHTVIGYLDSSNATPTRYWDEVTFKSDGDFYLKYVQGSAKYTNAKLGTVALSDNVITKSGAKIGYKSLNGEIPGCYEYDGVVTINLEAHKTVETSLLEKTVRLKGTKEWSETINAKIGDEVEYQIKYVNLSSNTVKNVMIRDILPTNMSYVENSTYLYNSNHQEGILLSDNSLTTSGINIGDHSAQGNSYVRFTAKVTDKSLACGTNKLVNWANSTVNSKVTKDDATVKVEKTGEVCEKKPEPKKDCTTNPEMPECKKPDPEPKKDCTTNPEMPECKKPEPAPEELPDTGMNIADAIISALGAGSIVTTLGLYIASRKKLM